MKKWSREWCVNTFLVVVEGEKKLWWKRLWTDSKTEIVRHYMVMQCGNMRHNPFPPPLPHILNHSAFCNTMSGTRKWKVPADYQRVQWGTKKTSRGVKDKQIVVFAEKARSAPSTPSKRATSTEGQQYFDEYPSEPLNLPSSKVSFLPFSFCAFQ